MPLKAATASTSNISPILRFHFWKPIYFNEDDSSFPSDATEVRGRFVGISENVGHDMTFKILNCSTKRSSIDPQLDLQMMENSLT